MLWLLILSVYSGFAVWVGPVLRWLTVVRCVLRGFLLEACLLVWCVGVMCYLYFGCLVWLDGGVVFDFGCRICVGLLLCWLGVWVLFGFV